VELAFEGRLDWLPTSARWWDPVAISCSKVPRAVLTPRDFPRTAAWARDQEAYVAELNAQPKPLTWPYPQTKVLTKFSSPPPVQLAA